MLQDLFGDVVNIVIQKKCEEFLGRKEFRAGLLTLLGDVITITLQDDGWSLLAEHTLGRELPEAPWCKMVSL